VVALASPCFRRLALFCAVPWGLILVLRSLLHAFKRRPSVRKGALLVGKLIVLHALLGLYVHGLVHFPSWYGFREGTLPQESMRGCYVFPSTEPTFYSTFLSLFGPVAKAPSGPRQRPPHVQPPPRVNMPLPSIDVLVALWPPINFVMALLFANNALGLGGYRSGYRVVAIIVQLVSAILPCRQFFNRAFCVCGFGLTTLPGFYSTLAVGWLSHALGWATFDEHLRTAAILSYWASRFEKIGKSETQTAKAQVPPEANPTH